MAEFSAACPAEANAARLNTTKATARKAVPKSPFLIVPPTLFVFPGYPRLDDRSVNRPAGWADELLRTTQALGDRLPIADDAGNDGEQPAGQHQNKHHDKLRAGNRRGNA